MVYAEDVRRASLFYGTFKMLHTAASNCMSFFFTLLSLLSYFQCRWCTGTYSIGLLGGIENSEVEADREKLPEASTNHQTVLPAIRVAILSVDNCWLGWQQICPTLNLQSTTYFVTLTWPTKILTTGGCLSTTSQKIIVFNVRWKTWNKRNKINVIASQPSVLSLIHISEPTRPY